MELAGKTRDALRAAGARTAVHCDSPIVTARFERDAAELACESSVKFWSRRGMEICGCLRIFITTRRIWSGCKKLSAP